MIGILLSESGGLEMQIVRDESGLIVQGVTIDETDAQNIDLVVIANKGDFKENPILGVNAEQYLRTLNRTASLRREIAIQVEAIGYPLANVQVDNQGKITIDT